MHESAYREMRSIFNRYLGNYADKKLAVVDIGGKDANGGYNSLISPAWKYVAVDVEPGQSVDIVLKDAYHLPFEDNSVHVVISGQYLEHVEKPWVLVKEMARILRPGGGCFINAPAKSYLHGYPHDYWRFHPQGMRVLLEEAGFVVLEAYTIPVDGLLIEKYEEYSRVDCWGIGIKK